MASRSKLSLAAIINAGSSSVKWGLCDLDQKADADLFLYRGEIQGIGGSSPRSRLKDAKGNLVAERDWKGSTLDHNGVVEEIFALIDKILKKEQAELRAAGHRIVHGGLAYAGPILIDAKAIKELDALSPLAPLHQEQGLLMVRRIAKQWPDLPQIACFDTSFHHSQPKIAKLLPLPRSYWDEGVRRYGFHGLSYEYIMGKIRALSPRLGKGRIIIAHLGSGASLCALRDGRSMACSMGFSALDGLMMGTRSGAIDPGILLYLAERGMAINDLQDLLYRRSGLLGVSGLSSDMRDLRRSTAPEAKEAIDLFIHRLLQEIGAQLCALGGIDGLVFTGGIGENDAATRLETISGLRWLGASLDEKRNHAGNGLISAQGSAIEIWALATDEAAMIAHHVQALLTLS